MGKRDKTLAEPVAPEMKNTKKPFLEAVRSNMEVVLAAGPVSEVSADWLVVPVFDSAPNLGELPVLAGQLPEQWAALTEAGDLPRKVGQLLPLKGVVGLGTKRLLLVGLGAAEEILPATFERAMLTAFRSIADKPLQRVAITLRRLPTSRLDEETMVAAAAMAADIAGMGQDLYRTERGRFPFRELLLLVEEPGGASVVKALEAGHVVGQAVNLARELVNLAPQDMTPVKFAERATNLSKGLPVTCEVFDGVRLKAERMESLLAVARGSSEEPRMVRMEYLGAGAVAPKLALVGKGVTFDSGGLSLKPTDGMLTMKCDMAGAATVLAAVTAIAKLKLAVNVVGYMGLVENMPGGNAFKLGDILRARNGVTIEVLNTDAEGRLVLADVLSYAVDEGVDKIIDLATLTGACVVALGEEVTGAFSNNQDWCDTVLDASRGTGEETWQLPMSAHYEELIKGDVGDIKNTGGRWGGAITAAKFLERFVGGKPWVHLDIAGPAFASSNKPHREGGGTGVYVRTLVELAKRLSSAS
jgi:leucyl aminopeptidase